jgi:CRP/FNR family transcriptional regulator, cyclic AMP receptor protein
VQGFLAELGSADGAALRRLGRRQVFKRGRTLFDEGSRPDRVFLVERGQVKVCHFAADGSEVVFAVVGPESILGELAVVDGEPRSGTCIAVEDVETTVVEAGAFLDFVNQRPAVALALLRTVTRRMRDSDRSRIEFGTQDTLGRLARRLVELAEEYGSADGVIGLRLTQEELAGWTGSSREAVVKGLRAFRERGWIETGRREIRVLDIEALRNRSTL